jgi:helix-turn-helix protein
MAEDHIEAALDITAAAKLLAVTPSALRKWKELRQGPTYFKAGRLVRYRRDDLLRWIMENTVQPDQQDFLARSRKRKRR